MLAMASPSQVEQPVPNFTVPSCEMRREMGGTEVRRRRQQWIADKRTVCVWVAFGSWSTLPAGRSIFYRHTQSICLALSVAAQPLPTAQACSRSPRNSPRGRQNKTSSTYLYLYLYIVSRWMLGLLQDFNHSFTLWVCMRDALSYTCRYAIPSLRVLWNSLELLFCEVLVFCISAGRRMIGPFRKFSI